MNLLDKLTTDKNEQRNLKIMGSGQILQQANASINSATLLQGLMLKLNFSNSQIAFVGTPGWIINLVMTFCASFFVDKVTNKAKVFGLFYLFTAIPTIGAVFITLGGSLLQNTTVAFYIMMVSYILTALCSPIYGILSYTVYMRAIHNNIRGRYTAICGIISGIIGILGGIFSTFLLKTLPYPYNFACIFIIGLLLVTASAIFLSIIKELPDMQEKVIPKSVSPLANFKNVVKMKEFRILMPANILRGIGDGAGAFAVVVGMRQLGLSSEYLGMAATILAFGSLLATGITGFCADKFGAGKLLPFIIGILVCALMGMSFAAQPIVFFVCYLIWYVTYQMEANAIPLVHYDVVPAEVIGAFSGVRLLLLNLTAGISSLIVGIGLDYISVILVFAICAFLKLIAGALFYNSVRIIDKKA